MPPDVARKPWPADAVMISAPSPSEAVIDAAEPTVDRTCRDCGKPVLVRVSGIAVAVNSPIRMGRPIDYLCTTCTVLYDVNSLDLLIDLRKPQEAV